MTTDARRLLGCPRCGLVCEWHRPPTEASRCPRCHGALQHDERLGLQRTWAFLAAALAMYLPANLLPVMTTHQALRGGGTHTLMGGIAELWHIGSWTLAAIVFVASVAVPLLKMAALALLAWNAQRGSGWARPERARLYRVVDAVGHWSMLDVFVVVLLVAMVRFGSLASVQPQPGLLAFGAVVVLTMLASESFDPRWTWRGVRR